MDYKKYSQIAAVCMFVFASVALAEPSLTVYNENFAVVRDQVDLKLTKGINQLSVTDITAHLEPDSVILRDPKGKHALQILEQNYRSDPVSQGLLLLLYEGKEIDFLTTDRDGKEEIKKGRIVRSGYVAHQSAMQRYDTRYAHTQQAYAYGSAGQPIVEVDGMLRFNLPGLPLFPSLADDTILKPTLYWVLNTDKSGKLDAELSYVTGGMSWKADYNMLSNEKDDRLDVIGWVTIDNQSGKTFDNARIKLMAGDVSKIQDDQEQYAFSGRMMAMDQSMPSPVSEKAFDEYHLYTLNRPATLRDRETKQVEFLRAEAVKSQRLYVYDGAKIDYQHYRGWTPENIRRNSDYGIVSNPKVWVMKEFENSQKNNLGIPLPRGVVRFYRRDDDGQLEFIGENIIDHTPEDETVRLYTGNAFDLVGERVRTNYQVGSNDRWLDEAFEIKVRNHKENQSVEIRVVEHLYRWINWDIVQKSDDFIKTDSRTVEFRVIVPPGQEKVITYKVHYTW
ncbi:MAG: DUF4139 domain-containing protein [Sedimentisphaerales bacterium]|nr:DUF4139 domain-containing protein [Sedimentisphaerales bacterium]